MARFFSAGEAEEVVAFLSAERSAERWARFRIAAARDFRRCLAADAILGKENSSWAKNVVGFEPRSIGLEWTDVKQ